MAPFFRISLLMMLFIALGCSSSENENDVDSCIELQTSTFSSVFSVQTVTPKRTLAKGWNLLQLPVESTTNVQIFFESHTNIHSIWRWDTSLETWQTYPKVGDYSQIEQFDPSEGYWVRANNSVVLLGNTGSSEPHSFRSGWNLIGYHHSEDDIAVESFLNEGNYWGGGCTHSEVVDSVWGWEDNAWKIFFPETDGLAAFNAEHQTSFGALTTLKQGAGVWVNTLKASSPQPTECAPQLKTRLDISESFTVSALGNLVIRIEGEQLPTTGITATLDGIDCGDWKMAPSFPHTDRTIWLDTSAFGCWALINKEINGMTLSQPILEGSIIKFQLNEAVSQDTFPTLKTFRF